MSIPIVYANFADLLRIAYVGTNQSNGSAIVNVFYYRVMDVGAYINETLSMTALAGEAQTQFNANVPPNLGDQWRGKSTELTLYKSPWRTELPDPNPDGIKRKMKPYATYIESNAGTAGLRVGAALPDYVVYRPIKYTGRAGRSWRGNTAFSPLLESDTLTTGNTWTPTFLAGPGLGLRGFMVTNLFAGDPTKEWMPVMFRITEYLKQPRVNPLTALDPTVPEWTPVYEARNANNICSILRSRRQRVGT